MRDYSFPAQRKRGQEVANALGMHDFAELCRTECYANLATYLKGHEEAEKFLKAFLGRFRGKGEYFPNGIELAEYFCRLLNIEWFEPERVYSEDELQPFVDGITDAFGVSRKTAKITTNIGDTWYAAQDADWNATQNVARCVVQNIAKNVRDKALNNARIIARDIVPQDVIWGVAEDAARGAEYIVVEDVRELKERYPENPWEKLLKIYELGFWPVGVSGKYFLLWCPPCLGYNDIDDNTILHRLYRMLRALAHSKPKDVTSQPMA